MTVRMMLVLALSLPAALAALAGAALYLGWPALAMGLLAAEFLCCLVLLVVLTRRIVEPLRSAVRRVDALRGSPESAASGNELRELARVITQLGSSIEASRAMLQQQAAQLNQALQSIIQTLEHPVAILSPEGQVELANAEAVHIGLLPGRTWDPAALPWLGPLLEGVRTGAGGGRPGPDSAIRVIGIGGGERLLLPRGRAVFDAGNHLDAIVLILADITALRTMERDQAELISGVAHELKTPLTSIQMSVHLLLDDAEHTFSARQVELLRAARDDAERLHRLIEEWLGRARGGGGLGGGPLMS